MENAKTFIFFDFECTQDDLIQCEEGYIPDLYGKCVHCLKSNCGAYEHKPNLCVVQKVCTGCMDKEKACNGCEKREQVFSGDNTLNAFCEWLFSEKNYQATVLCHNFRATIPIQSYSTYTRTLYSPMWLPMTLKLCLSRCHIAKSR